MSRSSIQARILRTTSSMFSTSPTGGGCSDSASSARPTARKCPCASMKPGSRARSPSSTTRVASPRRASTSSREPAAAIVSPRTATASTDGCAGSIVTIRSPRNRMSAGEPSSPAGWARTSHPARQAPAAQTKRTKVHSIRFTRLHPSSCRQCATVVLPHSGCRVLPRFPHRFRMAGCSSFTAASRRRTPARAVRTAPGRSRTPGRGARWGRSTGRRRPVRPPPRCAARDRPG